MAKKRENSFRGDKTQNKLGKPGNSSFKQADSKNESSQNSLASASNAGSKAGPRKGFVANKALTIPAAVKAKQLAAGARKSLTKDGKDAKDVGRKLNQKGLEKNMDGDSKIDIHSTYRDGINQMSEMEMDS